MTFVCANIDEKTCQRLKAYARYIGLGEDSLHEDLHATIVYSPESLGLEFTTVPLSCQLKPVGLRYLGEVGSKWRALVVEVESPVLQSRYDHYVANGYKPLYDTYLQHVSLAYDPPEMDLSKVKIPCFSLGVDSETIKQCID
jgi:hypothetical protein